MIGPFCRSASLTASAISRTCASNAPGGDRNWNRSCPCCAATSALARVPRSASAMWSTVTSTPLAVPQSLAYLSNQTSYDGTKWLHWRILRVFCGRLIRMVGPPPSAAARATPVVVVTKSRRSILLRLVMALPPCVLSIGRSWRDKVASGVRRRKASRRHRRRDVWQRSRDEPHQEQDHGAVHEELHGRVADEVARAHAQQPEEREHPERVDEVRQGLRGVVHLHHPPEVHLERVRGLEQIGRFDDPFAPARGHEHTEHGRIERHEDRIAVRVRDAHEQPGEPL